MKKTLIMVIADKILDVIKTFKKSIQRIEFLIEEGYKDQILLAHDLCNKGRLTKYGGHGLHYILSHIIPRMRSRGYSEESINSLLIENPKKMLTFKAV